MAGRDPSELRPGVTGPRQVAFRLGLSAESRAAAFPVRRQSPMPVSGPIKPKHKAVQEYYRTLEGYRAGERIDYTAELIDLDLSGELRLAPATLAAAQ